VKGRRLADGYHYKDSEPGDYWRQIQWIGSDPRPPDTLAPDAVRGKDYEWCIRDPQGDVGQLGKHEVTEHEDGTITVSPSILNPGQGGWHGFLERGVWRQV
jgi:hypothetical protein